jgi:pimeloyl-ACP methyl ester carboxylesterase
MFRVSRQLCAAAAGIALCILNVRPIAAAPFSPAPHPMESFDAGTLHADKFGSGNQVLVLIPGLAGGAWVWYDTIAKFSPTCTVYVITLPGFDGRAATDEKPLFTTFARDFWAMLAAHKIERPLVIGHSLGGTLAIAVAEEHPERLSGIVAADGLPVFPMVASATPEQRKAMARQMANTFASQSKADELVAQKNYMSTIGTNKPELVEPAAVLAAKSDPKAIAAWMQEDLTNDLRPNLGKITVPFLEIMPYDPKQGSPYTQEQTLTFYKSLIAGAPQATVVAVTPAFHFVMLDQPEAFYKAVAQFLSAMK